MKIAEELLGGNRLALSRAITAIENEYDDAAEIMKKIYPHTGKAYVLGITGPPGAGKSTLARAVAEKFGFLYVDTGAIYRSVGLSVLRAGVDPKDADAVAARLPGIRVELAHADDGLQHMRLNGEDVTEQIRTPEVSRFSRPVTSVSAEQSLHM